MIEVESVKYPSVAEGMYPWMETEARVISCHYQFARLHTFAVRVFYPSAEFLISFEYYAHGQTFRDQFNSPVAIAHGETFPLFYNPLHPQQNDKSTAAYSAHAHIFTYGLAASIFCYLFSLVILHGCK